MANDITCAVPAGAATTFHAAFGKGTMSLGRAKVAGLSTKACGAVTGKPGAMVLTVQPRDITFPGVSVKLLLFSVPSVITPNEPLSGPFKPGPGFTSAEISLTANLSTSARVLGFTSVTGPLTPTLTTGKSGSLQGTTFTGSLKNGFTGKVVTNELRRSGHPALEDLPVAERQAVQCPCGPARCARQGLHQHERLHHDPVMIGCRARNVRHRTDVFSLSTYDSQTADDH